MNKLNVQSYEDCAALQFRTTDYLHSEKILLLLCPYDRSQVTNMKMALSQAFDLIVILLMHYHSAVFRRGVECLKGERSVYMFKSGVTRRVTKRLYVQGARYIY